MLAWLRSLFLRDPLETRTDVIARWHKLGVW